jgi:hypothetical protein
MIRNKDINRLFDVVSVDFESGDAKMIEQQLTFDQAQEVIAELNNRQQLETQEV